MPENSLSGSRTLSVAPRAAPIGGNWPRHAAAPESIRVLLAGSRLLRVRRTRIQAV